MYERTQAELVAQHRAHTHELVDKELIQFCLRLGTICKAGCSAMHSCEIVWELE